ncbi:L,D-transpeptidase [Clostridium sp. ZS2-4]|uniref:L,D-transpeptidase n=1 Tax=Clostridium sp. ZS2-4 TaxID=2987703 RepID=UPI00227A0BB2|nr:L,D-transpeptidase [Clostridium sp. ZS2-4]MCY6354796.1 L,D-transpeptidase [Clostridium sp. ZS2-4]
MRKTRFQFVVANVIMILFLVVTVGNGTAYAAENMPKVEKIVYEYKDIYQGDTQTIDILSKSVTNVQYRVWISNKRTGNWQDITNGFTNAMGENQIFRVTTPALSEGDYDVSVWIKRAGAKPLNPRGYDTYVTSTMKCLKSNGQASNIKLTGVKNNYPKGEAIEIKKQENKEYLYKFSVYDLIKNKTIVSYAKDYKDSVSWKTSNAGIYLFKVNLKSIEKVEVPKKEDETSADNINKEKTSQDASKEEEKSEKKLEEDNKIEDKKKEAQEKEVQEKYVEEKYVEEKKEVIEEKQEKVEYKEIVTEEEITKLIIVGNPDRGHKKLQPPKGPVAPKIDSLVVGKASETSRIYIKAEPKSNSRNVGYIYGSLYGIKVLKKAGSYYYVEVTAYSSSKKVRGYIPTSNVKIVKPNKAYSVLVDLSDQHVYVFKNGKLIRNIICSTGQDWTPTPTGTYLIGDRGPAFLTGYNDSVICYNWVRFNNNYLFHSVLCTRNGHVIQSEAAKLGHKASHGCIRVPINDIKWFYSNVPRGSVVVIQQ